MSQIAAVLGDDLWSDVKPFLTKMSNTALDMLIPSLHGWLKKTTGWTFPDPTQDDYPS